VFDRELRQVADGVYVAVRPDVFRQPVEPNVAFIVNDEDVVVVDSGGGVAAAESALRLLRMVTDLPVRYLVNTHWHGDHVLGNAVFLQAFPGAEVVGHSRTITGMTGENIGLERFQPQLVDMIGSLRKGVETGLDDQGAPLTPERLARWRQMLPDTEAALAEYRRARIEKPTLIVDGAMTLWRGEREIQIRHLGRGNTDGDLVVWLPRERVVLSGDLVVHPLPYGFGSFPAEWLETLDRLAGLDFLHLVPGHGEIQSDATYLRQLQALIRKIRDDVGAAVRSGASLEAARAAIDLGELADVFTAGDERRRALLDAWLIQPLSLSAFREAKGEPIVQGQTG
jgi:glyoxylase-like metal-dependent hydrolase (beta-lactamase superfamily II)